MRIDRLREVMVAYNANNLLVTDITNIRYLTGFTGSSAILLVTPKDALIISDGRYDQQLQQQCPNIEAAIRPMTDTLIEYTAALLGERCPDNLYFEYGAISLQQFNQLEQAYQGQLQPSGPWIEDLRAVKDESEIQLIRQSIAMNQTVFQSIIEILSTNTTEKELAAEIEYQGRRLGADGCSFEPIVAVGANSALAHYRPGDVRLGEGTFTLIDWGLNYQGYASDLTRMVLTSETPSELAEIYDVTLSAQQAAIRQLKPGVEAKAVDATARDFIAEAGFGDQFNHGLGHGIGLNIHEGPRLSPSFEGVLKTGMVVTVEPGIYVPGLGGVRIEDDVLITEDGCEVLSNLPKERKHCVVPV